MEIADLIQSGGVAAFAGVVWYELRHGLNKVSTSIDNMAKGFQTGLKDIRKDMSDQREELAKNMAVTHERLNVIAKLSVDRATRATAGPTPTGNRLPRHSSQGFVEEGTGG